MKSAGSARTNKRMVEMEPLLDMDDIAAILRCSKSKVEKLMLAGELPIIKIGNESRMTRADLEAWIESRKHFHKPGKRSERPGKKKTNRKIVKEDQ